ncbi:hypothetical protein BD410DRAFT_314063 [Rickenella mellea]|uniref:Uncharacterized protein n=1 Tax=Rickenella mellea TaxID=50990 RepID=A0A4Y7Q0U5_9AGAM|nr:hypothetical protein BD410DRAFT_314063 [Rickenella mellea]
MHRQHFCPTSMRVARRECTYFRRYRLHAEVRFTRGWRRAPGIRSWTKMDCLRGRGWTMENVKLIPYTVLLPLPTSSLKFASSHGYFNYTLAENIQRDCTTMGDGSSLISRHVLR